MAPKKRRNVVAGSSVPQPTARLWYNSLIMPSNMEKLATAAQHRQLTTPLLLMVASHRPLTFVTGQLLYALSPICLLLGWEAVNEWAKLLSAADGSRQLTSLLSQPGSHLTEPDS